MKMEFHPKWWQKTVVYQIYPRSFKDSTSNGVGDLQGIISKLDYIDELGVETIWFSPFFPSPQGDHGYDIQDYRDIDPEYGTMDDFDELLQQLHSREMKIVLDMVLNHTSSEHSWFRESASSKDNPKRDWYIWRDGKRPNGKKPPNNWKSMTGGPAWKYYENTDQWVYFHFLPFQPDLNYRNPEVKEEMLDTCRFWLDKGVDGFRLDIFHTLYEREDLKDNPFTFQLFPSDDEESSFFQNHLYDAHLPETMEFSKDLRSLINEYENPQRFLVGEISGNMNILKHYYGPKNNGLNMVFLFQFTSTPFEAKKFANLIKQIEQNFAYPYTPTYVLGNHDRMRYITRYGNDRVKARLLATLQLTLRGVPFIYYGEEIGMENIKFKLNTSEDPIGRKFWWLPISQFKEMGFSLTRDGCRTPMQWDETPNAGFSPNKNAKPWLRIPKNYHDINVSQQKNDSNSLLNCYKALIRIRKENIALNAGMLEFINTNISETHCVGYKRVYGEQEISVYLNFSNNKEKISIPHKKFELLFSTIPTRKEIQKDEKNDIILIGYEALIIKIKNIDRKKNKY